MNSELIIAMFMLLIYQFLTLIQGLLWTLNLGLAQPFVFQGLDISDIYCVLFKTVDNKEAGPSYFVCHALFITAIDTIDLICHSGHYQPTRWHVAGFSTVYIKKSANSSQALVFIYLLVITTVTLNQWLLVLMPVHIYTICRISIMVIPGAT